MAELKWGSPEWRTHMRRSLAQRKRHGEKITDIEGLIDYIEKRGSSRNLTNNNKSKSKSITTKKPPVSTFISNSDEPFFKSPTILRGR